jgi:hypothetical protein
VLDFSLTKGSDDLNNRVDMSKPSRGCSEDFKSFDSVSLLHEVCSSCFGFDLDLFLKSYFDIHSLLIYFVPFNLSSPFVKKEKNSILTGELAKKTIVP